MLFRRSIAFLIILCLTFSQAAQAYSLTRLTHQPTQHNNDQRQATVSLINNKDDLGQTLNDMGSSQNVKSLVTAMVTAGALQGLNSSLDIQNVNAKSLFVDQLQKNLIDNAASATINTAINGGSLEANLESGLKTAFIDTGAAQGAYKIGDLYTDKTLNDFTHILAHAIAGCAAGAAQSGDCSSSALGAAVGELSAQLYGGARLNSSNLDIPALQTDTVNFARMMAGIAVALTGGNANAINLAANAGGNAAQNNYLNHDQILAKLTELAAAKDEKAKAAIKQKYDAISQANNDAGYKDLAQGGVMAGYQMAQDKAGLTAMLTGPTNCANDFACQVEVNKNLSEIQTVIQGHDPVGTIGSITIPLMTGNVLSVAGGAVAEWVGGSAQSLSAAEEAASWQGSGLYPGVDRYRNITLNPDTYVVGATPGQSNFYTTLSGMQRSGMDVVQYYDGLQIAPNLTNLAHDVVRDGLTVYRVGDATPAAFGRAMANPQWGQGRLPQIYIPDYSALEPVGIVPFINKIPGVKP